ncbi:ferredoxin [Streptosporangium longisporum]|uniref:Ferredoxin n=1 Tax=Streptosporangium longisporum TaxID=46187 RepID=A0ABN3XPP8_9ACTN
MWVRADRERCISGGRCMAATSDVFDQDDDGIVVVLVPRPAPQQQERVRRAAFLCPAQAIQISEEPPPG